MILRLAGVFLLGFFIAAILLLFFQRASCRYRILFSNVPLVGGLAIAVSFIAAYLCGIVFAHFSLSREALGIFSGSFLLLFFGLIDDWRPLSVKSKLLLQVIACSVLVSFGVRTNIAYIGEAANIALSFFWIIGITNAFNLLDVLDGLAGGLAVIAALSLLCIAVISGNIIAAFLSVALCGPLCAFLIYNLPPARLYLGNSGSHFLGFVLAALAIIISYAPLERKIALLSPLLILGFAIFDTLFLVLMRVKQKRPIFQKSGDHLALRFLKAARSKGKALLLMLSLGLFFSVSGIFLSVVNNHAGLVIVGVIISVSVFVGFKMDKVEINA